MTRQQLISSKRDEILLLASRHGARNVRLFGSVARGQANEESDLDVLVEAGPETSSFFPGGLVADLEDLLGCRVDVLTAGALHPYVRKRVLAEAVPL